MTVALKASEVASKIAAAFPGAVLVTEGDCLLVEPGNLLSVARFLKESAQLDFNYLVDLTSVDYLDYFEVVYHLVSLNFNHSLVLKTRCYGREKPTVPSVISLWQGVDLQEREVYDMMGIVFEGHPNMKRILLWEGFPGYPQRRDYL